MKGWGWVKGLRWPAHGVRVRPGVPALSQAQLFPVSADVATVRADLLLWATALIGVALAIYAFKRVRAIVAEAHRGRLAAACLFQRQTKNENDDQGEGA